MLKIKFTHKYKKIRNNWGKPIKAALLLHVFAINLSEIKQSFRDYDTDGKYPLGEEGPFLCLLFQKLPFTNNVSNCFTTIRRATVDKMVYYEEYVGQVFNIEIEGGD